MLVHDTWSVCLRFVGNSHHVTDHWRLTLINVPYSYFDQLISSYFSFVIMNSSTFRYHCLLFTILISLILHASWCYGHEGPSLNQLPDIITIKNVNTTIQQILTYEKSLFVGGRNKIFRLNSDNLTIDQELTIGPNEDDPFCLPYPEYCEHRSLVDSDVINMAVINTSKQKASVLLACLSTHQGMCLLMPSNDLNKSRFLGSPNQTVNFLASRTSSYLVVSTYKTRHAVFVAHSYDGRPLDYEPPTLSSRYITTRGWNYSREEKGLKTAMYLNQEFIDFPIKYIYGFNYSDYVYFLKVEPELTESSNVHQNSAKVTKLIRICANDSSFHSYTEVGLTCNGFSESETATFGKLDSYYESYSEHIKDSSVPRNLALFVSFKSKNNPDHSSICVYTLPAIHNKFDDAINRCFLSSDGARAKIFAGSEARCVSGQQKTVCGSSLNKYIAHPLSLAGKSVFNDENAQITSLNTVIQDGKLVMFAGSKHGSVYKISKGKELFSINLSASKIKPFSVVDDKEEFIYYASNDRLIKFPIKSCSIYTDCGSCVTALEDPLHCVWNGKTCVQKTDNITVIDYCEPKISSFYPTQGPIGGQTPILIKGKDLGSSKAPQKSVIVSGHVCSPLEWDNDHIKCQTTSVASAISGPIIINITDNSGPYQIRGTFKTDDYFHYQIPEVSDIQPDYSPRAGHIYVNIKGLNLDIGSKMIVRLAGQTCSEVIRSSSSSVKCLVPPFDDSYGDNPHAGIEIWIDGHQLPVEDKVFTYLPDPEIQDVMPNTALPFISTNLTVNGSNLSSFYKPQMICYFKDIHREEDLISDCYVNNDTQMMCNSPTFSSEALDISNPLSVKCGFSSAGGESLNSTIQTFVYYPMPLFNGRIDLETSADGKSRLRIEGKYLTTKYGPKIWLSRGDMHDGSKVLCRNLISQDERNLVCNLQFDGYSGNPSEGSWKVFAVIGNNSRLVGSISFPPDYRTPIIATMVIVVSIIIVVCVISLTLFFRRRCYLQKKTRPTPLAEYGRGNGYQGPQGGKKLLLVPQFLGFKRF